jgi:hypothetical protein
MADISASLEAFRGHGTLKHNTSQALLRRFFSSHYWRPESVTAHTAF